MEFRDQRAGKLPNVFEALTLPPRLVARAVEDLHTLATALSRLTEEQGDLARLRESASKLPEVEDELTATVASLQEDVKPLARKVGELNATATGLDGDIASLDGDMARLNEQIGVLIAEIQGFRGDIAELRDKIPGL